MKSPVWIKTLFAGAMLAVALTVILVVLAPIQVCTDRAFICQFTGSRHGYREWFFGVKTRLWQNTSALERFIQQKYPKELKHEWISYSGTGRNIFGGKVRFGHGRPGPILMLPIDYLEKFCQLTTDAEKKRLYDTLVAGDPERVGAAVDQACAVVWGDAPSEKASTNTAGMPQM